MTQEAKLSTTCSDIHAGWQAALTMMPYFHSYLLHGLEENQANIFSD
jgi:hypothetical protein